MGVVLLMWSGRFDSVWISTHSRNVPPQYFPLDVNVEMPSIDPSRGASGHPPLDDRPPLPRVHGHQKPDLCGGGSLTIGSTTGPVRYRSHEHDACWFDKLKWPHRAGAIIIDSSTSASGPRQTRKLFRC